MALRSLREGAALRGGRGAPRRVGETEEYDTGHCDVYVLPCTVGLVHSSVLSTANMRGES